MGITVGIAVGSDPWKIQPDPIVYLEDDGYYWFLHPLFLDLQKKTGQYIDLYDYAAFREPEIAILQQTVAAARKLVEAQQSPTWRVQTGTLMAKTPFEQETPVYATVDKNQFLELLNSLDDLIRTAEREHLSLLFLGD